MNKHVDQWIDDHFEQLLADLQASIQIPSVYGEKAAEDAPYGREIRRALDHALQVAERLGFETKDVFGHACYAEYGEGEETLGVLSHLDVVPAGQGWDYDSFGAVLLDDRIVGRGARDDKGPAFCALYALAALKACRIPLRRKIRLIMGCNEESGMLCMDHYLQHEAPPTLAFSPDGDYPVVNAEKSSYFAIFKKEFPSQLSIKGGTAPNMIPGTAEAVVPLSPESVRPEADCFASETGYGVSVKTDGQGCRIEVTGKQGHAAVPEEGKNALQGLIALLVRLPLPQQDLQEVETVYRAFKLEKYGESMGIDREDPTGRTTANLPIIDWNENGYRLQIDIRCPVSLSKEELDAAVQAAMGDAEAELLYYNKGLYIPPEDELVGNLLRVYQERTGIQAEPVRCGGGTYARKLPHAVAFGIEYEGSGTGAHQANEFARFEELRFNAKIIADAMIALAGETAYAD